MSDLYPVFFNLEGAPCLVVGGGWVALRKVKTLLEAGAQITVMAPFVLQELKDLGKEQRIRLLERSFEKKILEGQILVFSATDDEEVNRAVYEACEKARIPVNVADQPGLCRFQVPARFKEGLLQVAVSTKGGSPAFSRSLCQELGGFLSPWAPRLVQWLAELREALKKIEPKDSKWRGDFLNQLMDNHLQAIKNFAKENQPSSFNALVEEMLVKEGKGRS
jgi:siroheme synthase-like protein